MSEKKVIGIVGYIDAHSEKSFGAGRTYLHWISKFGNARIIMPWEDVADVDMLILPGGADTAPSNYNDTPGFYTGNSDVFKDHFFRTKLAKYVEKGIPIVGICLGMQQLAAFFGCKLHQHMLDHTNSPSRGSKAHTLYKWGKNPDYPKKKGESEYAFIDTKMDVNGHHHQALLFSETSGNENIEPIYYSVCDGSKATVEAFKIKDKAIYGVQWHPEEFFDAYTTGLMKELLK